MTNTSQIINCPACGKEMQKFYLSDANVNIDICSDGCGGIFFDNQELQAVNKDEKNIDEIKKYFADKTFPTVDANQIRICPACGTKMVKNNAFGVIIDTCYNCGAIFLDKNEIDSVKLKAKNDTQATPSQNIEDINLKEFYNDAQQEELVDSWKNEYINEHGVFGFIRQFLR